MSNYYAISKKADEILKINTHAIEDIGNNIMAIEQNFRDILIEKLEEIESLCNTINNLESIIDEQNSELTELEAEIEDLNRKESYEQD